MFLHQNTQAKVTAPSQGERGEEKEERWGGEEGERQRGDSRKGGWTYIWREGCGSDMPVISIPYLHTTLLSLSLSLSFSVSRSLCLSLCLFLSLSVSRSRSLSLFQWQTIHSIPQLTFHSIQVPNFIFPLPSTLTCCDRQPNWLSPAPGCDTTAGCLLFVDYYRFSLILHLKSIAWGEEK